MVESHENNTKNRSIVDNTVILYTNRNRQKVPSGELQDLVKSGFRINCALTISHRTKIEVMFCYFFLISIGETETKR